MSISTHYHHQNPNQLGAAANDPQVKSDLQALGNDLNSSDVTSAQKDFAAFLSDASKAKAAAQSGSCGSKSTAMDNLQTSLQAGDLSGAKSAFSSLGQAMHAHHHGHHHAASSANKMDGSTSDDASAEADPSIIRSDLSAIGTALQAGDVTSAQQALIQLQKDDPKLANASNSQSTTNTTSSVTTVSA